MADAESVSMGRSSTTPLVRPGSGDLTQPLNQPSPQPTAQLSPSSQCHGRCGGRLKFLREIVEVALIVVAAIGIHELVSARYEFSDLSDKFHVMDKKMDGIDQKLAHLDQDLQDAHKYVQDAHTYLNQMNQSQLNFQHQLDAMNATATFAVTNASAVAERMERSVTEQLNQMKHWVETKFQQNLATMRSELDGVLHNLTRVQNFTSCLSSLEPFCHYDGEVIMHCGHPGDDHLSGRGCVL